MNPRQDLLHLSPEALAQAVTAGIVKCAVRELEGGYLPQLTLGADGTLDAKFSDGIHTVCPAATAIWQVRCSCGATSVCRHRIIVVLAYRNTASSAAVAQDPSGGVAAHSALDTRVSSPGQVSYEIASPCHSRQLASQSGAGSRGWFIHHYSSDCQRRAQQTARLPSAIVRFWAGAALEAARCACLIGAACDHVALGVWAFQQADKDATGLAQSALIVRLGNERTRLALNTLPWVTLVEVLVRHGVCNGATPMTQAMIHSLDASRALNATWLVCLQQDLKHWCGAWQPCNASYQATVGLALVADLALRLHGGVLPGNARAVLG